MRTTHLLFWGLCFHGDIQGVDPSVFVGIYFHGGEYETMHVVLWAFYLHGSIQETDPCAAMELYFHGGVWGTDLCAG